MAYTVLARRYRSQGFDEVVGQEAIAKTLANAIAQGRVAHAYLFVGTRGVGKTSMARIFAKALNGGSPEVDAAIMRGDDTDVIEIDAASNRGVEEARELIANSIYRPLRGKYKIYIIDEVHMLTREAFNTLLKTMEEPPQHVKFILCTTEAHKVLPTIQSRCQRFDFRSLSAKEIAAHLVSVAKGESVNADNDVLYELGRLANGSMRDGLSLLDRVMAAAGKGETLTLELLSRVLGLPERALIDAIVEAIAGSDASGTLQAADAAMAQGVEMFQMLEALADRFRDLMVVAACGEDSEVLEVRGEARKAIVAQSASFDAPACVHMIALVESISRMAKSSSTPRALVDALMVRLALTEQMADVAALLSGQAPAPKPVAASTAGAKKKQQVGELEPTPTPPPSPPPPKSATSAEPTPPKLTDPGAIWDKVLERVSANQGLASIFDSVELTSLAPDGAAIITLNDATKKFYIEPKLDLIAQHVSEVAGVKVMPSLKIAAPSAGQAEHPHQVSERRQKLMAEASRDPMVQRARELFDARLIDVEEDTED
ncbi:MAG: DNA polymerase III subunit gamma/tau [Phycisphaerales bacterium]|nr:DNA polymerase III subunit gamma/tau [Phycisphaerales bacterium]